jgi:SAM-dependent methyltransferase
MNPNQPALLDEVAQYYTAKLAEHGETPKGVDWNGAESQELRFAQLCRILPAQGAFSLNDLGCGYGAFHEYLARRYPSFSYTGWDVSEDMVRAGRARVPAARFEVGSAPAEAADYGFASGIFNVKLEAPLQDWRDYVEATLDDLDRSSRLGFAFNCLTSWSDADRMRPHLYYPDPCELFAHCKRKYARNVALLHDYGLYEFTILVRKVVQP